MSVDSAAVKRIAKLARIKVDEADIPQLEQELNSILHWVEQLNEVDVSNVEPLTSVVAMKMKTRNDEVTDGHYPKDVTANAPASDEEFYVVPKVVE